MDEFIARTLSGTCELYFFILSNEMKIFPNYFSIRMNVYIFLKGAGGISMDRYGIRSSEWGSHGGKIKKNTRKGNFSISRHNNLLLKSQNSLDFFLCYFVFRGPVGQLWCCCCHCWYPAHIKIFPIRSFDVDGGKFTASPEMGSKCGAEKKWNGREKREKNENEIKW